MAVNTLYFENKLGRVTFQSMPGRIFTRPRGVAYESDGHFVATDLNQGAELLFVPKNGGTLKDWVAKTFGDSMPVESENKPGMRYKRIARPVTHGPLPPDPSMQEKQNGAFVALRILLDKLEELFQTVEPDSANAAVYGHRIRELLLLACMEVESSWKAVLEENGYTNTSRRFTTNDYVKLLGPMMLDSYHLSLQAYTAYPAFCPFAGWDKLNPTSSLNWYNAYNQTKHDRERNLWCGTLDNAIRAVGATVAMFYAQFGLHIFATSDQRKWTIENTFRTIPRGLDTREKDFYVTLYVKRDNNIGAFEGWKIENYSF
jgi:hypothetical protein